MPIGYWGLLDTIRVPLDKDMMVTMLGVSTSDPETLASMRAELEANSLAAHILIGRLPKDVQIADDALVFTIAQITSPGEAVMYAYTLALVSWLTENAPITLDTLTREDRLFAWGVPDLGRDSADSIRAWDAQKRNPRPANVSDNWLDDAAFWEENKKFFWGKGLAAIPSRTFTAHV